jgi:stage V sporulation protein R
MTQEASKEPGYLEKIRDLLSCYEEGWDIFKVAKDWDHKPTLRPKALGRGVPQTWLGVAERVFAILAKDKYGLQTYPNQIRIIDSQEMLHAYASVGMPVAYSHWSYGKNLIEQERAYARGEMGLAYEIVINTNPSIAYCMTQNTKTMQMLVIAHASFGHNSFFRNNHMFVNNTNADTILQEMAHLRDFVAECEEKYGEEAVEQLLDAAHALQNHGVHRRPVRDKRTPEQERQRRLELMEARERAYDPVLGHRGPVLSFENRTEKIYTDLEHEENLLKLMANLAPHLEPWQRQMLTMISDQAQYFYPQRQTQLMNEGWATFWHHTLMNDLFDLGLVNDGMMQEFLISHTNVIAQPPVGHRAYTGFNPYALGFAMFTDIKRICLEPTEEDVRWFPGFAGNPDWVSALKWACEMYKDEGFVEAYLSPKVIRDFHIFNVHDDGTDEDLTVSAIHDEQGYRTVRDRLAAQYNLGEREPRIEATAFYYKTDRTLVLTHTQFNERPLDDESARDVLQHVHRLWRHPVVLQTVSPEGEILHTLACPKLHKHVPRGPTPPDLVLP